MRDDTWEDYHGDHRQQRCWEQEQRSRAAGFPIAIHESATFIQTGRGKQLSKIRLHAGSRSGAVRKTVILVMTAKGQLHADSARERSRALQLRLGDSCLVLGQGSRTDRIAERQNGGSVPLRLELAETRAAARLAMRSRRAASRGFGSRAIPSGCSCGWETAALCCAKAAPPVDIAEHQNGGTAPLRLELAETRAAARLVMRSKTRSFTRVRLESDLERLQLRLGDSCLVLRQGSPIGEVAEPENGGTSL